MVGRWSRRGGVVMMVGSLVAAACAPSASRSAELTEGAASVKTSTSSLAAAVGDPTTVSAGGTHTCEVITGGTVRCWGRNNYGQLGTKTNTNATTPSTVVGVTGVTKLSAGYTHTCAIVAAGAVKCWGANTFGQLGNNTTVSSNVAVTVSGVTGATAISAGYDHTCAIVAAGAVKCWGRNTSGQLGNNSIVNAKTPVAVTGITGATRLSASGVGHTCAVVGGGAIKCWGNNTYGQLGNNTEVSSRVPVSVFGTTGATAVSLGGYHSCAIVSGFAKCWGNNTFGQLGTASNTPTTTAATVAGITGATEISSFYRHTCALVSGAVKCWGSNQYGQLGVGNTTTTNAPVAMTGVSGATVLTAGANFTCSMVSSAVVKCTGQNSFGQLGNGTFTTATRPVTVVAPVVDTLVANRTIRVGALGAGLSTEWTYTATKRETLNVALFGSGDAVCPAFTVLNAAGGVVGALNECGVASVTLPSAGTFRAKVTATSGAVAAGVFELTASKPVAVGALGGSTVSAPVLVPGQKAVWTFAGTAGRVVDFAGWNTSGGTTGVDVVSPSGVFVGSSGTDGSDGVALVKFAVTGSHTVAVTNRSKTTAGKGVVQVAATTPATAGVLGADTTVSVPALSAGRAARWTSTGQTGVAPTFTVSGTSPTRCVTLRVVASNDAAPTQKTGCGFVRVAMPPAAAGVSYEVFVVNTMGTATSATVWKLSKWSPLNAGSVVSGTPKTTASLAAGRSAQFTYTGVAGATVSASVLGVAKTCYTVTATGPTGVVLATSDGCNPNPANIEMTVPTNGVYRITVDNVTSNGATGPVTLKVAPVVALPPVALTVGTTVSSPSMPAGQQARWSYAPGGGIRRVILNAKALTLPAGACVRFDHRPTSGQIRDLGTMCGGATLTKAISLDSSVDIRMSAVNGAPLSAGALSVTLAVDNIAAGTLGALGTTNAPAVLANQSLTWNFPAAGGAARSFKVTTTTSGCFGLIIADPVGDTVVSDSRCGAPSTVKVTFTKAGTFTLRILNGETTRAVNDIKVTVDAVSTAQTAALNAPAQTTAVLSAPINESACQDVLFLGARGSGQQQSKSEQDGGTGFGAQVNSVSTRLASALGSGRKISRIALVYPAKPVESLATDPKGYFDGLETGVTAAKNLLISRSERNAADRFGSCPSERIVLSGYSQGAMVMHRLLLDLHAAGRSDIVDRIDGAILIADGDRIPHDNQRRWGTAGELFGGVGWTLGIGGTRKNKFPGPLASRVHSVCNANDAVCDHSKLVDFLSFGVGFGAGFGTTYAVGGLIGVGAGNAYGGRVHMGYTNTQPVWDATDAAAKRIPSRFVGQWGAHRTSLTIKSDSSATELLSLYPGDCQPAATPMDEWRDCYGTSQLRLTLSGDGATMTTTVSSVTYWFADTGKVAPTIPDSQVHIGDVTQLRFESQHVLRITFVKPARPDPYYWCRGDPWDERCGA